MTGWQAETVYCDGGVVGKNPSDYGGVFAWRVVRQPGSNIVGEGRGIMVPWDKGDLLAAASMVRDTMKNMFPVEVVVFEPTSGPVVVTNNQSELMAAIHALENRPEDWDGRLVTDSTLTIKRMTGEVTLSPSQVPLWMIDRLARVARSRRQVVYSHVAGHPTKADLRHGHKPNGEPVSHHQHWCDRTCVQLTEWYMIRIREVKARNGGAGTSTANPEHDGSGHRSVDDEAWDVYKRASLPTRYD